MRGDLYMVHHANCVLIDSTEEILTSCGTKNHRLHACGVRNAAYGTNEQGGSRAAKTFYAKALSVLSVLWDPLDTPGVARAATTGVSRMTVYFLVTSCGRGW